MSFRRLAITTATFAGLLTAMPAWGWGGGWDTDSIAVPGEWTPSNVDFGMDLFDDPNMSVQDMTNIWSAPPAEPWCATGVVPNQGECNAYLDDLDWWVSDALDLDGPAQIPPGTPIAPPQCPNSCLN